MRRRSERSAAKMIVVSHSARLDDLLAPPPPVTHLRRQSAGGVMNVYDLNKRIAVVTGGAQGIGLAVANRILASGGQVAIWDRDRALLDKTIAGIGDAGPHSGPCRRYRRPCRRRSGHQSDHRALRQDRHPRQQRRDRRPERADLGVSARGVSRRGQCRAVRHVLLLPRRSSPT